MNRESWPPEWQRGFLEMLVLGAVKSQDGPTYGYRIVQELERRGFSQVKGGTLYPILARLEREGLITSHWGAGEGGPGRKFVQMTSEGKTRLELSAESWLMFGRAIDGLLNDAKASKPLRKEIQQ